MGVAENQESSCSMCMCVFGGGVVYVYTDYKEYKLRLI